MLHAQGTTDVDIITGVVLDTDGKPIRGARIDATDASSTVIQTTTSDGKGFYQISFFQGSGVYRMSIRSVGVTPASRWSPGSQPKDRIVFNRNAERREV